MQGDSSLSFKSHGESHLAYDDFYHQIEILCTIFNSIVTSRTSLIKFPNIRQKDDDRIKEILRKALKFAKNSTRRKPNTAYVYVNVLDKLIFYYKAGVETVSS